MTLVALEAEGYCPSHSPRYHYSDPSVAEEASSSSQQRMIWYRDLPAGPAAAEAYTDRTYFPAK